MTEVKKAETKKLKIAEVEDLAAAEEEKVKGVKRSKGPKREKEAVFRMCTASEVQQVLKATGALYPEDNQWVAYPSW